MKINFYKLILIKIAHFARTQPLHILFNYWKQTVAICLFICLIFPCFAQINEPKQKVSNDTLRTLDLNRTLRVLELRNYVLKPGQRENFTRLFKLSS